MDKIRKKFSSLPRGWRWVMVGLLFLAVAAFATPAVQVAYVRFANPSTTGPITVNRWKSGGAKDKAPQLVWCDLKNVSPEFSRTVWVAEDGKFFRHGGFDWEQIHAAQREAARTGKPARGASTITQQCARSLFLWQGRSWTRKVLEAYYTVWMELLLSKQRIFELYVNVIELGKDVYGIEAASQFYFKKSARELTTDEAASLAAIMPRPRVWSPLESDAAMLQRKAIIMERSSRARYPFNQ